MRRNNVESLEGLTKEELIELVKRLREAITKQHVDHVKELEMLGNSEW